MTELRPLGYFPDDYDVRDRKFGVGAARAANLPDRFSHIETIKEVGPLFQYKRGTCVIQVIAQAIRAVWQTRHQMGRQTPVPSRRGGYYLARAKDGNQHSDDGCKPRYAMEAFNEIGFTTEDSLPYDEDKINDTLPASTFSDMADQEVVMQYRRILEGDDSVEQVKEALSDHRRLVGFAVDVVPSFDEYEGGVWSPLRNERSRGGHYLLAVGYDDRLGAFQFVNSWDGWGVRDGDVPVGWMSYDVLLRKLARDCYAIYPGRLPSHLNQNVIL